MKKQILHILIFLLIGSAVSAQEEITNATQSHRSSRGNHMLADAEVFQATIKNGNNPNQFLIYLKPNTLIPVGTVFAVGPQKLPGLSGKLK